MLPIVFDTLYEVHLFAAIPVLCVWLLLLTARAVAAAAALALLCGTAVLVRNEYQRVRRVARSCPGVVRVAAGRGAATVRGILLAYRHLLARRRRCCAGWRIAPRP